MMFITHDFKMELKFDQKDIEQLTDIIAKKAFERLILGTMWAHMPNLPFKIKTL